MKPTLVIGNRNYSTWSLRPWLFLRHHEVDFQDMRLPLDTDEFRMRIREYSPSGRVPVLVHGERRIWDSLAICEYANETFTEGLGWPEDAAARAEARSVACEMHAGFNALRSELPMNCRALDRHVEPGAAARRDIVRVVDIWEQARKRYGYGGPWLYGRFSIADAMFAPVASRFRTYGIGLTGAAADWAAAILAHPAMKEWMAAAIAETEVLEADEAG